MFVSHFNGVYILKTLESLGCPATMASIKQIIADDLDVPVSEVRDWVKESLEGGVKFGFVQKQGQRFYLSDPDAELKLTVEYCEEGKKKVRILVYRGPNKCEENVDGDTKLKPTKTASGNDLEKAEAFVC